MTQVHGRADLARGASLVAAIDNLRKITNDDKELVLRVLKKAFKSPLGMAEYVNKAAEDIAGWTNTHDQTS